MTEPHQKSLNLVRGLVASMLCGAGGALLCLVLAVPLVAHNSLIFAEAGFDQAILSELEVFELSNIVVGCGIICACAGWATFVSHGHRRFASSLMIICLLSFPLWCFFGWLAPFQLKTQYRSVFDPLELIELISPPILAAGLVTLMELRNRVDAAGTRAVNT